MENYKITSRKKRFINWIIDGIIITILWFVVIFPLFKFMSNNNLLFWMEEGRTYDLGFTIIPILIIYYLIFEGVFKTTPGKLITKTRIVKYNGENIRFSNAIIRTICRIIPFEQFSFLAQNPEGWHDQFSNTIIIDKNLKVK